MNDHPLNGEYTVHGVRVKAEVSPCSWMYKHYGFQFEYKDNEGYSQGYILRKSLAEKDATAADVQDMLDTGLTLQACESCGVQYLFNELHNHRGQKCKKCHETECRAELEKALEREAAVERKHDARMKKQGYTHKVNAWIHPARGDDHEVSYYFVGKPSDEKVKTLLRKEGSQILTDYEVIAL